MAHRQMTASSDGDPFELLTTPMHMSSERLEGPQELTAEMVNEVISGHPIQAMKLSWRASSPRVTAYQVTILEEPCLENFEVATPTSVQTAFTSYMFRPTVLARVLRAEVAEVFGTAGPQGTAARVCCAMEKQHHPQLDAGGKAELQQSHGQLRDGLEASGCRQLRVLLLGQQHHGKSSFVNHLMRYLGASMDIANVVESAPASEEETTLETAQLSFRFHHCNFLFMDCPAFSTMNADRRRDVECLLWSAHRGWRRGAQSGIFPNPPDVVVIVVSLMECEGHWSTNVRDYLRELQRILKNSCTGIVFPFVVVATHKDVLLERAGNNHHRNPNDALHDAIESLKRIANSDNVYPVANYKETSWWSPSVNEATFRLLRQAAALASARNPTRGEAWMSAIGGFGIGGAAGAAALYGLELAACPALGIAAVAFAVGRPLANRIRRLML